MAAPVIAVVDNDASFLEMMADLLCDEGYDVRIYTNGPDIYQRLQKEPPALIILDICPVFSAYGWRALDLLRLDPVTTSIPIIACSDQVISRQSDWLAGMGISFQEKPFLIDELLAKIEQALSVGACR